jgi:hypothetical protein
MFNIDSLISEIQADENFASDIESGQCRGCAEIDYLNEDGICCECSYAEQESEDHQQDMIDFYATQAYDDANCHYFEM